MNRLLAWFTSILIVATFTPFANASDIRPMMVYESGVIMDNSWNEAIHNGILRFEKKMKVDVEEVNITDIPSFADKISKMVQDGYNPIIFNNVGTGKEPILKQILDTYPKTRFIVLNGVFNVPNAYYFAFSYQEASFLAGYLASKKSKTGTLGFVGGMDIAIIRNFLCGYVQGARYHNPNIKVDWDFIGTELSAWYRPKDAYRLAKKQIDNGADIIFSPSGGSSVGALEAAHDNGVLGIGVDSNQNHLFPGSVLTSVLVKVDNVVFRSLLAAYKNIWGDQVKVMGLQENGVGLAYDENNAPLISQKLRNDIEVIKEMIILKEIKVNNYIQTHSCTIDGETLF